MNKDTVKDVTPSVLSVIVSFAFLAALFTLLFVPIPDANKSAFDIVLGLLGGAMTAVLNFYFGSSAGSEKKDATIKNALAAAAPIVPSTTTTATTVTQP